MGNKKLMTMYRLVNGVQVPMSAAEATAQLAEWATNNAAATALATNYITVRAAAINALGDYAIYTATHGANSYETAVAAIIAANPAS